MNPTYRVVCIGAVACVAGLAACSSEGATSPSAQLVPDSAIASGIANDVGDAMATSLDLMGADEQSDGVTESGVLLPGGQPDMHASKATDCSGPDGSGWFTCIGTWRGLSLTNMKRYWDGTSLALGFTPATDSVNHIHSLTGSYTQGWFPFRTVWVNRTDTANLSVVRTTTPVTHVWNKVGVRQDSTMFVGRNVTRHWRYLAYDTATNVTFDMPRSENIWPVSGSIVHNVTVHFEADRANRTQTKTVTRRAMITFNGTADVTLQAGGLTCTLDLETHEVSDCQGS
jgi:hypothetical protein